MRRGQPARSATRPPGTGVADGPPEVRAMSIVLVELIGVFGLALGIGLWQLRDVNRELRRDRDRGSDDDRTER